MSDIRQTLEAVRRRLNESLSSVHPRSEEWVVLSNFVDHEGRPYEGARDKLVMFLANVKHETVVSTYNRNAPGRDQSYGVVAPPLFIDVFLLFAANFWDKSYPEGLELLSRTISFFQQNPWFTRDTLPSLPPGIEKLAFEITNLDLTEMNYLMAMAGTKYLPSVYYKVRAIPFVGEALQAVVPAARGVRAPGEPQAGSAAEDGDA
jgi:hypothetical protein